MGTMRLSIQPPLGGTVVVYSMVQVWYGMVPGTLLLLWFYNNISFHIYGMYKWLAWSMWILHVLQTGDLKRLLILYNIVQWGVTKK